MSAAADPQSVVLKGRMAMDSLTNASQARVDEAVTALAWAVYEPDAGMGNVDSKITNNTRKTFGTLRELMRAKAVGVVEHDEARGMVKYAKPVGVFGAVTPSTTRPRHR